MTYRGGLILNMYNIEGRMCYVKAVRIKNFSSSSDFGL